MFKKFALGAATVIALATAANADALTDSIVSDLTAQGYERIEIKKGRTQTKVEAIRGTEKLQQVFSRTTGSLLKEEVATVNGAGDTTSGVSVRTRNHDSAGSTDRTGRKHRRDSSNDHGNGYNSDSSNDHNDNSNDHSSDNSNDNGNDHSSDHSNDNGNDHSSDHSNDNGNDHSSDHSNDNGNDHNDD